MRLLGRTVDGVLVRFVGSTVLWQGSRFVGSVVAARALSPDVFGVWNVLNLLLIYGGLSNLGILNGMGREIPFLEGQGRIRERVLTERVAFFGNAFGAGLFAVVALLVFAVGGVWRDYGEFRFLVIGVLIVQQVNTYALFRLRSARQFLVMARVNAWMAGIHVVSCIAGVLAYGLSGFIIAQIPAPLFAATWVLNRAEYKPGWAFDKRTLQRLLSVGLPIMLAGFVFSLLSTVDRWVILGALDERSLGFYSISIMTFTAMTLIPRVVSDQFYPEMAYDFGRLEQRRELWKTVLRQTKVGVWSVAPLVMVTFFALDPLVRIFLPKYVEGIDAARCILLGVIGVALSGGAANFLNVTGLQQWYLLIQIIMLAAIAGAAWVLVGVAGITGVAIAFGGGLLVYGTLLLLLVRQLTHLRRGAQHASE